MNRVFFQCTRGVMTIFFILNTLAVMANEGLNLEKLKGKDMSFYSNGLDLIYFILTLVQFIMIILNSGFYSRWGRGFH